MNVESRDVVDDLAEHAWRQMLPKYERIIDLAEGNQKAQVATMIAAMVIGAAAGIFAKLHGYDKSTQSINETARIILDLIGKQFGDNRAIALAEKSDV